MDQQVWFDLLHGMGYVLVAFASVYFSGWLIYDKLATRGYCLSKALFEDRNMAAGLEISAFFPIRIFNSCVCHVWGFDNENGREW